MQNMCLPICVNEQKIQKCSSNARAYYSMFFSRNKPYLEHLIQDD